MNVAITTHHLISSDVDLLKSIVDLFAREFEEPPDPLAPRADDNYLAQLLARESFVAIAALAEGAVVGGTTGHVLPKTGEARSELYLYDLAVASDWRRRGIATAMIERLREVAREKGAHVIFVQADVGDSPAIALYSRYGAQRDVLHFEIPCG
jgi:aminoglycoside 3-N-acetyltransferase I